MSAKDRDPAVAGAEVSGESRDFVTMTICNQLFGIPVLTVQDVLGPQKITRIPLASPEVAGALNLRGRIVTAIGVRKRLGLPPAEEGAKSMSVVVDFRGELYSLIIDSVGEVLSLPADCFERNPATLDPAWREVSGGVFRLKNQLLVVLDVARLLAFKRAEAA
ncbi:MAG TPA: chemotaxis protein CheW [Alphaproteobacteria bacterium]|jgi:purine-binding chemotaxis protein CheW|nr:chemotaxis protein CheW [Alphaproteobacteria bacterium]